MVKNYAIMVDIKKYIDKIKKDIKIDKVLLFGSYAKNCAAEYSDVDLAIVSEEFGKAPLLEKVKLNQLRHKANISYDIEPVPISLEEYLNGSNFFIQEIKDTGLDLTSEVC